MTARDLLIELQALSCHALTDTNVEAVMFDGGRLWLDMVDRDADVIDDLKKGLAASEAACKEAEAEAKGLNAELDRVSDAEWIAADEAEQIERIKREARRVMERCEIAERELMTLRRRKGIEAGYVAARSDVMLLLNDLHGDPNAMRVLAKIRGLK